MTLIKTAYLTNFLTSRLLTIIAHVSSILGSLLLIDAEFRAGMPESDLDGYLCVNMRLRGW